MKRILKHFIPRHQYKWMQYVIVLTAMVVVAMVTQGHFVNRAEELRLRQLDQVAEGAALMLDTTLLPSSHLLKGHILFIIDEEGNFVVDREPLPGLDAALWEQYRTKLLYQMQKQKRGWIYYPEQAAWPVPKGQRVIRYLPLESTGWILAVETWQPGWWFVFKEEFPEEIAGVWLALFAAAVYGVRWTRRCHDRELRKVVSDELESRMVHFTDENMWPSEGPALSVKEGQEPLIKQVMASSQEPAALPRERSDKIRPPEPSFQMHAEPEKQRPPEPPKETAYDGMTIELKGIKSGLLKDMIRELREK